jgi:hypothetical protein
MILWPDSKKEWIRLINRFGLLDFIKIQIRNIQRDSTFWLCFYFILVYLYVRNYFFSLSLQPQFGPSPTSMKLSLSLRFTKSVGLLGLVISSSQGLYLYPNTEKRERKHAHKHETTMSRVEFEPTNPASEGAKTMHAWDRSDTVTGRNYFDWMDIYLEYATAIFDKSLEIFQQAITLITESRSYTLVTCVLLRIERYWFDYPNSNNYANPKGSTNVGSVLQREKIPVTRCVSTCLILLIQLEWLHTNLLTFM